MTDVTLLESPHEGVVRFEVKPWTETESGHQRVSLAVMFDQWPAPITFHLSPGDEVVVRNFVFGYMIVQRIRPTRRSRASGAADSLRSPVPPRAAGVERLRQLLSWFRGR